MMELEFVSTAIQFLKKASNMSRRGGGFQDEIFDFVIFCFAFLDRWQKG